MAKKIDGDDMKPGGGGRFKKVSGEIQRKEGVSKGKADAIAAGIGRKKYGKATFQDMATKGKKGK